MAALAATSDAQTPKRRSLGADAVDTRQKGRGYRMEGETGGEWHA